MEWIGNLFSGLIGAIIGGFFTAHAIGRWRGQMESSMQAIQEEQAKATTSRKQIHEHIECLPDMKRWRDQVDGRLADGDARLERVAVLDVKIEETTRTVEAFQVLLKEGMADIRQQLDGAKDVFMTKDLCNERHRRRQQ